MSIRHWKTPSIHVLACCDYFRTPVKNQVPDIFVFVGVIHGARQLTYARNLQLIVLVRTPIYGSTDFSVSQSHLMWDNICNLTEFCQTISYCGTLFIIQSIKIYLTPYNLVVYMIQLI